MKQKIIIFLLTIITLCLAPPTSAQSAPHQTLIINQVRGDEYGSTPEALSHFQTQLDNAARLGLPTNFALRYDTLTDSEYQALFATADPNLINFGAFLEITPSLAAAAGVRYQANSDNWSKAGNAYNIGYSPEERIKLLDAYMNTFLAQFGRYPNFSTAWMIDPDSLAYLRQNYGLLSHQITREQFGTDSYTLQGGPAHLPYYPSRNWALIPSSTNAATMPLIVRQTITDPVFNYADTSNAYTSQPNDYALRGADFSYFQFLFNQAHDQIGAAPTFALIGLENTMPADIQEEFTRQLEFVANWQTQNAQNQVVTIPALSATYQNKVAQNPQGSLDIYGGVEESNPTDKAWWITTPNYRIRLRLSQGKLYISDLRLYHPDFTDPYLSDTTNYIGQWEVPSLFSNAIRYDLNADLPIILNDSQLIQPRLNMLEVHNLLPGQEVSLRLDEPNQEIQVLISDQVILTFGLDYVSALPVLSYADPVTQEEIFSTQYNPDQDNFYFQINSTDLDTLRQHQNTFNAQTSKMWVVNDHAVAGRNPIRMVFYPRDISGDNLILNDEITVNSDVLLERISTSVPNSQNGMIYIDFDNSTPTKAEIEIAYQDYLYQDTIYFAPDCKADPLYCLTHPVEAWWFTRNWFGDKIRAWEQQG